MMNGRIRRSLVFILAATLSLGMVSSLPAQQTPTPPPAATPSKEEAELTGINKEATAHYSRGELQQALSLWQEGLSKAQSLHLPVYIAKFLNNLGVVYYALGQYNKALDHHTQALELRRKAGNPEDIASSLGNLGNVYDDLGQDDKALDYHTQALELHRKAGNPIFIANSLNNLGNVSYRLGQHDKALDYYTQALELFKKAGNPTGIASSLGNLGNVYDDLGQDDKALDYHTQALELHRKAGNPTGIANSLNNLGNIYDDLGQYDKALDYHIHALELRKKMGNLADIANSLNNLGNIYDGLGQYDKALDYHTQALEMRKNAGNSKDIADSLNNLGNASYHLGKHDKALDYLAQSLEVRKKMGNPTDIATCLINIGNVYDDLGQINKAFDYYTQALELYKKTGNPIFIAKSLTDIGNVSYRLGQYDKALDYHNQALELFKKTGNSADIATILSNIAIVQRYLHHLLEAETAFAECRRLRESLTYQVGDPSQVGALQDTFGHFYENYAALLLDRTRPQDALEMLEAGRGQGLARQIDLNRRGDLTRLFTPEERATLDARTTARQQAAARLRLVQQQADNVPQSARAALQAQVQLAKTVAQQTEQAYTQFRDALFARYPDLRRIATGQPAFFSELQALARDHADTLYLEYGIVDDKTTLLFALGDKDGLKTFTLPTGEKALKQVATRWRQALERSGGREAEILSPDQRAAATRDEQKTAKQAYTMLLGAAEKVGLLQAGRYKRLVFVGSGAILSLPLAALCDGVGNRLMARYPLSQAISLSAFFWRANPNQPTASLLCIADTTGTAPMAAAAPSSKPLTVASGAQANKNQVSSSRGVFRGGFAPLPGAREEGQTIAALFPGATLLVGTQAREHTVVSLLPRFALLHFATHGFLVPGQILASGLVLADPADSHEDGLLTASKIMNLPLSARLAVLSACDTGRGVAQGGEGLLGLAWAFRAAGCPSLIASQWQVSDAATRTWMTRFYGALKAGKAKDEALRSAMLAVQRDQASPYFWAAFTLIGDTSPLPHGKP